MRAHVRTLDPNELAADPAESAAKSMLGPLVYETLVRIDDKGEVQPLLAASWRRDVSWNFLLRRPIRTPEPLSELSLLDDRPIARILREQARFAHALADRALDGSATGGTGPFKIARWDPGRSGTLVANDDYWGGRPYLDSIDIQMGRDLKDQALDLSLGKTDITETGERNGPLANTLALLFTNERVSGPLREALSSSLDRSTIQKVLARSGEATHALLPRWLSGYSFLFSKDRDVARARQLAAGAAPLTFIYDRQDAMIRRIAERIAVNAMEAGIMLRPVTSGTADVRLELLPVMTRDELGSLEDLAALLKMTVSPSATPYEAERGLLDGFRVIPVLHLADSWTVSPRVHDWPNLVNVWLSQ